MSIQAESPAFHAHQGHPQSMSSAAPFFAAATRLPQVKHSFPVSGSSSSSDNFSVLQSSCISLSSPQHPFSPLPSQSHHRKLSNSSRSRNEVTEVPQAHSENFLTNISCTVGPQTRAENGLARFFSMISPRFMFSMILGFTVAGFLLIFVYHNFFIHALQLLSGFMNERFVIGFLITILLLFVTAFPPTFGFSTMLVFCGYVYGFPFGILPAFLGSFMGACCCFMMCKTLLAEFTRKTLQSYPTASALTRVIRRRGFKMVLLIRIAPYPFNYGNAFFAAIGLPKWQFLAATSISLLLKSFLEVLVGSRLIDISNVINSHQQGDSLTLAFLIVGLTLAAGIMLYLWVLVRQIVNQESLLPSSGAISSCHSSITNTNLSETWLKVSALRSVSSNPVTPGLAELNNELEIIEVGSHIHD